MNMNIFIVEDDVSIYEALKKRLGKWSFREDDHFVNDNTLTANITRLRQKLAILQLDEAIVTKKGLGYMAVTF